MRRGLWLLLVTAVLAWPWSTSAAPEARLLYVRELGAERCPDERAMREAVAQRLGYDPFSERAPTTVSVVLDKGGRGLRARIELVDGLAEVTGARELTSRRADCEELFSTVELAISIAIDPLSFAREPESAAAAPPETRAPEPAPPSEDETPGTRGAPDRSTTALEKKTEEADLLRPLLGAGALAALGAAPTVAFGFTAEVGVRKNHWSVAVELRADVPTTQNAAGGKVSTGLYALAAVPCFHQSLFAVCALGVAGAQVSNGAGFTLTHQVTTPFVAAGLRAGIEVRLFKMLAAQVDADLLFPITRTVLQADDVEVFRTQPVQGAFHLVMLGYFK